MATFVFEVDQNEVMVVFKVGAALRAQLLERREMSVAALGVGRTRRCATVLHLVDQDEDLENRDGNLVARGALVFQLEEDQRTRGNLPRFLKVVNLQATGCKALLIEGLDDLRVADNSYYVLTIDPKLNRIS